MTTDRDIDQIVDEYLSRLDIALAGLPAARRQQLIDSISDHISEARVTLSARSEVAVLDILERIGQPADIAAAAMADQDALARPRATRSRRMTVTAIALFVAVLLIVSLVLASSPNGGSPPATTRTTVNSAPRTMLPQIVGMSLSAAEAKLQASGFAYRVAFTCAVGGRPQDTVVAQSPISGSTAPKGSYVRLFVIPMNCP